MANSDRIIGLETDGSVPVTIVSGGGTGGTASTFGAAFPPTGTAAGFIDDSGNMAGGTLDASGFLKVNVAAGSSGNAAASATGGAVPASADYQGVNVGGTLSGVTGVNPSGSIIAEQVDLASVAGITVKTGAGTATGAIRVELPTDGTGVVKLAAGTAVIGHVITDSGSTTAVTQATASSLNATIVGSGSAGTAATGVVTVQGIASMTKLLVTPDANSAVNVAQVGGTNTVTGGVNGTLAVGGNVATNVAIGTNPVNLGAQAVSAENSAVTATRMAQLVTDLVGKLIVLPYANPENFVSGTITTAMTGTTGVSLMGAPTGSLRNYITQITVSNAHATVGTDINITDGATGATLYVIPAAATYGGATLSFPTPLRQPTAATALYAANVTTGASTKVSASGYKGL